MPCSAEGSLAPVFVEATGIGKAPGRPDKIAVHIPDDAPGYARGSNDSQILEERDSQLH